MERNKSAAPMSNFSCYNIEDDLNLPHWTVSSARLLKEKIAFVVEIPIDQYENLVMHNKAVENAYKHRKRK